MGSGYFKSVYGILWQAAEESAEETATMTAGAGRASYVSKERQTQPDPGAKAVAIILRTISNIIGMIGQ